VTNVEGLRTEVVASTPDRERVICGACQRANGAGQEFCSHCGHPLWATCLNCGKRCLTSQEYCGACGGSQQQLVATHLAAIENALRQAERLEEDRQFSDAILAIRQIRPASHHLLEPAQRRLRVKLEQLQGQLLAQQEQLRAAVQRMQELVDTHQYGDAIRLFESLPASLQREDSAVQVASVARDRKAERTELREAIRTLVAQGIDQLASAQYLTLLPKILRFLEIAPGNEQTEKLASRVSKHLLKHLKAHMAQHQYQEAFGIAEVLPPGQLEGLFERVAELAWIERDLRDSPLADATLAAIAQRFVKESPENHRAAKLLEEIVVKVKPAAVPGRFPGVAWAKLPRRTTLGITTDWLGGMDRIRVQDAATAEDLARHPGAFFTAVGLALQGLGKAQITINLAPRRSMLQKIALAPRERVGKAAWGIDVGDFALKAVKLVTGDDDVPELVTCTHLSHPHPVNQPGKEAQRGEVVRQTLAAFLQQNSVQKNDVVCVNFPSHLALARTLSLPNVEEKKFTELVRQEVRRLIPIPEDELVWGSASQELEASFPRAVQRRVALLAAKKGEVDNRLRTFQEAQLRVDILQFGSAALHNAVMFDGLAPTCPRRLAEKALAIVDIGSCSTTILASTLESAWIRSLHLGGNDFTDALARAFQLTHEQAERLKRQPSRARSLRQMYEVLTPLFRQLSDEIQRTLASYHQEIPDLPIERICLVGEGVRMHGLLRHLIVGI
jgi:type IV pilus assembly protein PilM